MRRLLILTALLFTACTHTQHAYSTGSHAPFDSTFWSRSLRVAIVTDNPFAADTLVSFAMRKRDSLIDRNEVRRAITELGLTLPVSRADDSKLLQVGKGLGANLLLLADVSIVDPKRSPGVGVAVRALRVDTGQEVWRGFSAVERFTDPATGIPVLTRIAVSHAFCRIETGYTWTESSDASQANRTFGCHKPKT